VQNLSNARQVIRPQHLKSFKKRKLVRQNKEHLVTSKKSTKQGKLNSKEEKFETKLLTRLKQEKHTLKTLWKILHKHLQVLNHAYTKKDHNQVKIWN